MTGNERLYPGNRGRVCASFVILPSGAKIIEAGLERDSPAPGTNGSKNSNTYGVCPIRVTLILMRGESSGCVNACLDFPANL